MRRLPTMGQPPTPCAGPQGLSKRPCVSLNWLRNDSETHGLPCEVLILRPEHHALYPLTPKTIALFKSPFSTKSTGMRFRSAPIRWSTGSKSSTWWDQNSTIWAHCGSRFQMCDGSCDSPHRRSQRQRPGLAGGVDSKVGDPYAPKS